MFWFSDSKVFKDSRTDITKGRSFREKSTILERFIIQVFGAERMRELVTEGANAR